MDSKLMKALLALLLLTLLGAASIEVHGAISQAGLSLELVRSRRAAWLGDLRARENCAACTIDGGRSRDHGHDHYQRTLSIAP